MSRHSMFFAVTFALSILAIAVGNDMLPSSKPDNYGQATVQKIHRVDLQCHIYCDIQDWPAIIAKEMPVQIRGFDTPPTESGFDLATRQFILETLTGSTNCTEVNDPNQPPSPTVLLKRIQRGQTFCLVADVEVNGQDLAQMLVDKGYVRRVLIPQATIGTLTETSSSANGGFVASKSGKVFHKPSCPHAKRISDNTKVTYRIRDEAIRSGKRPCQTCNP